MKNFLRFYLNVGLLFLCAGCAKKSVLNSEKGDWVSVSSDSVQTQKTAEAQEQIEMQDYASNFVHDDGRIFDTLFVSSLTGAKITLEPNSESLILAHIPFNSPLKAIEIVDKEWVKVSVPRYLRSDGKDEGFIYALDLSVMKNPLKELPEGWKPVNLRAFLESCQWKKRGELSFLRFNTDGTFSFHSAGGENSTEGTWRTVAKDKILLKTQEDSKTLEVKIEGSSEVKIADDFFESKFSLESLESDILNSPVAYSADKNGYTLLEYASLVWDDENFIYALISSGVSPGISPYRERYDEFWSEKQSALPEITAEWQPLPDLWADDFRYLFASADVDADGKSEGLYENNGKIALVKNDEKKAAILDFPDENIASEFGGSAVFELFMPYNLVHRTPIIRVCNSESDSLFALSKKNAVEKICSLPKVKEDSGEARKIFFSENGIFIIDFSTEYGCISSDCVRVFTQDKTDFAKFTSVSH